MISLADKAILSGADNHPPMLEKDMYDSWKSRMELYMLNRQHGRMILESFENSPLLWLTVEENGVTRLKKYSKLSTTKAIQADCDVKATNIIKLTVLYQDVELALEKQVKEMNNIVFKRNQFAQTVHMLTKPQFFYDHSTRQALGFQNPCYLKRAQQLKPKLYDGSVIQKTDAIVIHDSEETLMLEDESLQPEEPNLSSSTTLVEVPKELPKVSMAIEQHCVEKNKFQDKMKNVLKDNERLLEEAISVDIVNIVVHDHANSACKTVNEKVLVITSLKETLSELKGKAVVNKAENLHPIDPELLKIDVAPLAPKLRNNRTAHTDYLRHTQEETSTIREIVKSERLLNPLNTSLDYASAVAAMVVWQHGDDVVVRWCREDDVVGVKWRLWWWFRRWQRHVVASGVVDLIDREEGNVFGVSRKSSPKKFSGGGGWPEPAGVGGGVVLCVL
uniref:Integrase, catalytic region, zinc finger, CCHC-type, peptidase aspartic, catalytic n=1 Tax=Tanacetum cinerariifolium TaxID=118510 RepID=A0A6L2MH74_TANCI|nr:hypothetical protein [Tanacetum cinerariifolium]